MTTGNQIYRSPDDKYVEDVFVTTKDLNFDVDIMSRKDIMSIGMIPINKFRANNRLILLNGYQLISTIVTFASMLMTTIGMNNVITIYYYVHSTQTQSWGCISLRDEVDVFNTFKPIDHSIRNIAWLWISSGLWGSVIPLLTGYLMNCSTNLSSNSPVNEGNYFGTIFYNANFPPKNPQGVNVFRLLSLIDLIVVFVLSIINAIMSRQCNDNSRLIIIFIYPIVVAILCIVVFLLILFGSKVKKRDLSRDENLHVGHTHILLRKFPVEDGSGVIYKEPQLVGYGPPVEAPRDKIPMRYYGGWKNN